MLWFEHVLWSLTETQGQTRVVVDYDRMMENTERELRRIAKAFQFKFDEQHPDFIEYTTQFLDKNLTHTQYKREDLSEVRLIAQEIVTLYQLVYQCATEQILVSSEAVTQVLNSLKITLKNNHMFLHYLKQLECKLPEKDKCHQEEMALLTHEFRRSYSYRLGYYLLHAWQIPQRIMSKLKFMV